MARASFSDLLRVFFLFHFCQFRESTRQRREIEKKGGINARVHKVGADCLGRKDPSLLKPMCFSVTFAGAFFLLLSPSSETTQINENISGDHQTLNSGSSLDLIS